MQSKHYFIQKSGEDFDEYTKIIDLGSGQSKNFLHLLERYPDLYYVGVEPDASEALAAKVALKDYKYARVYNQQAYELTPEGGEFDICFSLSVLEHVKQLERFLITSIQSVKKGGKIVHRYDLGHALYPSSLKEQFQVFLGNNYPNILPEHKFVRYLDEQEVISLLEKNGAKVTNISYHQMPSHKSFEKYFKADTPEKVQLVEQMHEWEYKASAYIGDMDKKQRQLLFPSILIEAERL